MRIAALLHLHLRHDRPAEGGQRQPSPHPDWSHWFAGLIEHRAEDRMYNCLPLYHSVGGVVAVGCVLVGRRLRGDRREVLGRPLLGRRRGAGTARCSSISASCAAISLNASPRPGETRRTACGSCCGNGLRGDVWEAFQERFAHPADPGVLCRDRGQLLARTTSRASPAPIGRVPPFLAHRFPAAIVRFDVEARRSRCAARTASASAARRDEAGEAIGGIVGGRRGRGGGFEGYTRRRRHRAQGAARRVRARRRAGSAPAT